MKIFRFLLAVLVTALLIPNPIYAQTEGQVVDETMEAKVIEILEQDQLYFPSIEATQLHQKLKLIVTKGSLKDQSITVENGNIPTTNIEQYHVGDELVIVRSRGGETDQFYIADYVRRSGLITLAVSFVIIALLIGRWHGITSLLGMGISYVVIFFFILPQISAGRDPVTIAIIGTIIMVPLTFYLSHGYHKKTHIAVGSTILSLIITGVLANFFVGLTKLTGFGSEEASFLQSYYQGALNIKGLLLAGIIIGGLGIFDDITISQASIVAELKSASPKLKFFELYKRAMNVGHDHIASLINTLVLVYTGAALPLLLLFLNNPRPFAEIINYEFMADEIVRTLVASIGLMLAVPITTGIAAYFFAAQPQTKTNQ